MGDVPPEGPRIAAVATLARALLNVTLIQVLGYMMAKHKLLPEAALPGAGAFIGLVSLPAIYFRAVATLDFGTVRVQVLVALLLGKLLLVALSSTTGSSGSSSARRAGVQRASAGQRATGEPARITGRRAAETRRTTSEAASPVAFVMFCICAQNGRRGIGEHSGIASAPRPAKRAAMAKT